MNKLLFLAMAFATSLTMSLGISACAEKSLLPTAALQTANSPTPVAHFAGDFPDPSAIRVGDTYWAVATTSAWAPAFTLMTSKDLTSWDVVGAVFPKVPAWTDGHYWAPEIVTMDGKFFVYYTAKNKKNQRLCVAVATAKSPSGPYQDHGPLVCEAVGSIDAATAVDENGQKYLFWKEDGNSQKKPTPIRVQKLSKTGTKLVGKPTVTITNDSAWEKQLVEAPFLVQRNGQWYMFYAGSDCCGRECKYAVGVARSKSLLGPWEKNPANPILSSNEVWKCPGHGSVVTDDKGQDIFLYHAYHAKDFNNVGRQMLVDGIDWDSSTGWPSINNGLGAGINLNRTLKPISKKEASIIHDDFSSTQLSPTWLWPFNQPPDVTIDPKQKKLTLTAKSSLPTAAILAKMTSTSHYSVTTELDISKQKPKTAAGLAAVGNPANSLVLSYQNQKLTLWRLQDVYEVKPGTLKSQPTVLAEKTLTVERSLHLRMMAREGHFFQFAYSTDGSTWNNLGDEVDGSYLPPWDLGIRAALVASSGTAVFNSFKMESKVNAWK